MKKGMGWRGKIRHLRHEVMTFKKGQEGEGDPQTLANRWRPD